MSHSSLSAWQRLFRWAQSALVTSNAVPADPVQDLDLDPSRPLVYVLPNDAFSDRLALHDCCLRLGLPSPFEPVEVKGQKLPRVVALTTAKALLTAGKPTDHKARFEHLLELHQQHHDLDVQLVPVSLLWGRDPGKERPNRIDDEQDVNPTWLRKLILLATRGRDNFIRYSRAVSLRYMADHHGTDAAIAAKLARVARVHFRRQRAVATGPKLPDRKALFRSLLNTADIKSAIAEEAKAKDISDKEAQKRAQEYLDEIAADYSGNLIRLGDRFLNWLWNRLYQGIEVRGGEQVRQLSQEGHEIVFVPCHRSHMDYLLLSYVIYHQGMVPPHIAAGVNLNFWPAGPIFRHGGAFFIRRSFKGNKLYAAVFREYVDQLFKRGYSVEYFCEGGRSRTGRLLPPKTGLIAMTINSVLSGLERPITLVPVYLGYDHVMEVATYNKELLGKEKKKESAWQIFSAIRKLRNYGQGFVNFGAPITVQHFLNQQVPKWRQDCADGNLRHRWVIPSVNKLADQLMLNINGAAAASAVTLTASALLASNNHSLERLKLESQLDLYLNLLRAVPYTSHATVPAGTGEELLAHALTLNKFELQDNHRIAIPEGQAANLTFYRNNTMHLLVLPSLLAHVLNQSVTVERKTLLTQVKRVYPLLQAELFMSLKDSELDGYLDGLVNEFVRLELVTVSNNQLTAVSSECLQCLAALCQEPLQRYVAMVLLLQQDINIARADLTKQAQALAKTLSQDFHIGAPEFYDKTIFTSLTAQLKTEGYLKGDASADAINELAEILLPLVPANVVDAIRQDSTKAAA